MNILFITTCAPFSRQAEIFVLDELLAYLNIASNFWVLPVRRRESSPATSSIESGLLRHVVSPALFSLKIALGALRLVCSRPQAVAIQFFRILRHSGGLRNLTNNLIAFPKTLWLAEFVRSNGVDHIHAYWLSHTATMAMVAAELANISWSATGYRWDIECGNHMRAKFSNASFLRCADELGMSDMTRLRDIFCAQTMLAMVRTGVHIPSRESWADIPVDTNRFVCAGAFVPKKQQELLVRAFALHHRVHPSARLELIGDGPLRHRVSQVVKDLGIEGAVSFCGTLTLEQLRALLKTRPISVLPSITTESAEQEGIPVVLIEAMANGSPVVSTNTGSIGTLVLDDCGLLVEPGSVASLVEGLSLVAEKPSKPMMWADRAYARLGSEFDGRVCAGQLAALISSSSAKYATSNHKH